MKTRSNLFVTLVLLCILAASGGLVLAQDGVIDGKKSSPTLNRADGINMLSQIKRILKEHYYDPNYKGIDLDARIKMAEEQVRSLKTRWEINRAVAQVLIDLNDSHTKFYPPNMQYQVEYGFATMMVGKECFVVNVMPGTDAQKQGLSPGDRIDNFNGIVPTRETHWIISYLIYSLDPQSELRLKVTDVKNIGRDVLIRSKFSSPEEWIAAYNKRKKSEAKKGEVSRLFTCKELAADVTACKLRTFRVNKDTIKEMMKIAGLSKKLILDLRGNGGGSVDTEMFLTGSFFEKKVKIGTEITRKTTKERHSYEVEQPYRGDLFVLIDSNSGSASEVFARTIQLEKRGKVIGDISAGAVMTSITLDVLLGGGTAAMNASIRDIFAVQVTVGNLIMTDGKSLEAVGVLPDHLIGPTQKAMALRNDPVLAFAAELAGVTITPEKAGELGFFILRSEDDVDAKKPSTEN